VPSLLCLEKIKDVKSFSHKEVMLEAFNEASMQLPSPRSAFW